MMIKSRIQTDEKLSINISYFYDIYMKEKRLKNPSFFSFDKRHNRVSIIEYRLIVKTFLMIYFKELYFTLKPKPFFFGGFLKVVKYDKWIRKQKKAYSKNEKIHENNQSLGLFWYRIPSYRFHKCIKLAKLTGTTNELPKIEKMCKQQNDIDKIPIFNAEIKRFIEQKSLFRNVLINHSL